MMKRAVDICAATLGLLVTSPLLAIVAVLIKLDSHGPVIFRQVRVGKGFSPFRIHKFRTMVEVVPGQGLPVTVGQDARVTRVGRILRKYKLDELPQLVNVFVGDMSLVGPRPCLFNQYELIAERLLRGVFDVRPGVTGRAQIIGIDMSTPRLLAETDALMLADMSVRAYLRYNFKTLTGLGRDFE